MAQETNGDADRGSVDVLPRLARSDIPDRPIGDFIFRGQLRPGRGRLCPDLPDGSLGQTRPGVTLPSQHLVGMKMGAMPLTTSKPFGVEMGSIPVPFGRSPLLDHVDRVDLGIAGEQMIGTDTSADIAVVEDPLAFRNRPIGQFPGDAVGTAGVAMVNGKSSVSRPIQRAGPEPAGAQPLPRNRTIPIDLRPESVDHVEGIGAIGCSRDLCSPATGCTTELHIAASCPPLLNLERSPAVGTEQRAGRGRRVVASPAAILSTTCAIGPYRKGGATRNTGTLDGHVDLLHRGAAPGAVHTSRRGLLCAEEILP